LLLEYHPRDVPARLGESLVFINEGPGTIKVVSIGPLLWNTTIRREINLHNVMGPIRANQQAECTFAVFEKIGESQNIRDLPDMLRDVMRLIGHEAQAQMVVVYEDLNQRCVSRQFVSSIDPYNRVVWNPGPIYPEGAAAEAI
jgi:hypothetical protein